MRILSITGPVNSPVLNNAGENALYVQVNDTWDDRPPGNGADFAPQSGLSVKVQNNDSHVGNVVYRNGHLWFAHTVFLPVGSPTRSAIQWWQVDPNLGVRQRGRIEDATATNFYAFPSIAVNRFNDVLIGFSRYSSNQYVSANYAFRSFKDPQNTMQAERVLKAGEDSYWKQQTNTTPHRNRWGDYSATQVDPLNDGDFWTIQEYSRPRVGSLTNLSGRWGVWWGNVAVTVPTNDNFSSAIALSGAQGATNGTNIRATKETDEPNHAGNTNTPSVWYSWTAPADGNVSFTAAHSRVLFDMVLAIYTGSSVGSLTTVTNRRSARVPVQVTFNATSNAVYRIAIAGFNGASGEFALSWTQPTAPMFTEQPQGRDVFMGSNVTFTAMAIGVPNPAYQWRFNGTDIAGAAASSFTTNNVSTNTTGDFTVVATNSSGSATSAVAHLQVYSTQRALLSDLGYLSNGFRSVVSGITGATYVLEASTNLFNWSAIETNQTTFTNLDVAAPNFPSRFYRVLFVP